MPPKSQNSGMQQQQQQQQQAHGANQNAPMGYPSPHAQHHFHHHDSAVDGPLVGANMPMPHRHNQYQQPPPPNAGGGGGKRGGGGNQQQQQQQQQQGGYGGGYQDYPQYGGNSMHYGGGGNNEYGGGPPPHSGNSSPNASITRRNTGTSGGPNNNSNMPHQHHFSNQQGMPPMPQQPPQGGGGYYGGPPMPPPGMNAGNPNMYGMDQGGNYNQAPMGGRDSSQYADGSGVASPNPPPPGGGGGGYMPPPAQPSNNQGQRRGGGGGNYNNNNMNAMGQQPPPPPQQQQQQQRYNGGGNNNNNMYRGSPYPAPNTPHHHQQQPPAQSQQQAPLSMPPPQQQPPQQGGGGKGGNWQPPQPGMMSQPPPPPQNNMGAPMQMPQGGGGGGGNYGYANNNNNMLPPPPPQPQQPQQHQAPHAQPPGMYQGPPPDMGPGGYGGGVPYSGGGGNYGGNNANYGPPYDGPGSGMPSSIVPPPGGDPSGMMGAGGPVPPMNMRGASMPPQSTPQPPMGPPSGYPPIGGMMGGSGDPRASMPPQDYRNAPMPGENMMGGGMAPMPPLDYMEQQKDLYTFLHERRLLKKRELHEFFPAGYDVKRQGPLSIAVDGNYLLTNLRTRMCNTIDPLWFLHSSLPDCLTALVNTEVQRMRQNNLEPVWVFQGIGISGDVEAFLPTYDELRKRGDVWTTLMEGSFPDQNDIADAFVNAATMGEDVVMAVQRFLRSELNVLTVTAPFSHWCQMCALHHEGDVQLLYGHPEMLMVPYAPMKLIVEIDFDAGTVAYFDRDEVLRELFPAYVVDGDSTSASDRLLDLGLLVATQPVVTAARASTTCTLDTIYAELSSTNPRFRTLAEFITANEESQPEARRGNESLKHSKGRAYMRYSAVFTKQYKESPLTYFCRVLDPTLDNHHTPNNLSGVFGNHLPLCLFFFQYAGLVSVSFMTIITQSYFRDEPPPSDSMDYQECLPKLMALRSQIVFQIVPKLDNEAYQQRLERLSWVRWFHKVLIVVQRPPSAITLDEWRLEGPAPLAASASVATAGKGKSQAAAITAAADDDDPENVTVTTVLNTSAACLAPHEVGEREVLYHGRNQTMQAILLKSLDFLGYYTHKPQMPGEGEEGAEMADGATRWDENGNPLPPGAHDDDAGALVDPNDGNPFTKFLRLSLSACDDEFQSALVRFTELVRVQVLNATPPRYIPILVEGTEDVFEKIEDIECDADTVRLASRIACLVTVPYLEESTTGPVDDDDDCVAMPLDGQHIFKWAPVYSRSLCAFSIMARAMNRDLRELVEAIAASLYLQGHSDCTLEDFTSFTSLLPFGDVPSAIGGLLLHYVLVFPDDYDDGRHTIQARCARLHERFRAIRDITTQLRRVMEFTFQALFLLNAYLRCDSHEVSVTGLTSELVDKTLDLLAYKWALHLAEPVPEDVHHLWPSA